MQDASSPILRLCSHAAAWATLLLAPALAAAASRTPQPPPIPAHTGHSLGGLVLPVEPREGDIAIRCMRGWHWRDGSTQRLVVQGDALIEIAGWRFEGPRLVLWLDRIPSSDGLVTQVALWIPESSAASSGIGHAPTGRNLLIVGSVRGETVIDTAMMTPGKPRSLGHIVKQADDRLAAYVAGLERQPPILEDHPVIVDRPAPQAGFVPVPGGSLPAAIENPLVPATVEERWLRQPGATIAFSANHVTVDAGEIESTILIDGNVVVHYRPANRNDELGALRLSAERAVIYASPTRLTEAAGTMSAEDVRGIYLEGAVVAESDREDYVVRAQRMYYDFVTDRAVMLDAVLRTYDRERRVPVFARADELRQLATDQWSGSGVQLSASSFATPTLSIGAATATIRQIPGTIQDDGTRTETKIEVTGEHNTLRAGGVPFFYWPYFKGYADRMPLAGQSTSFENYKGVGIEFKWDLPALLGLDPLPEDRLLLETSGYSKRGPALGLNWQWNRPGERGGLSMWGIHDDTSKDERLSTGLTEQVPKTWRGYMLFEDIVNLGNNWKLQAQASWISDAVFMNSWQKTNFRERREYETSLYLSKDEGNASLSALIDYSLNDFISNSWLLASQGFQLDEFPKATYRRFGDDLFETLTYSGDISFSRFRAIIPKGTASENGINVNAYRGPGVVFNPNDDIATALAQRGIGDGWFTRINSMHHVTMPLTYGAFQVTPFASAQLQGFIQNDTTVPGEDSDMRGIGGVGLHATTTLQRVYNGVDNDTLGLHRLRVLFDPWVRTWISAANFDPLDVPDYDPLVDATARGGAMQFGLRNRIQTQRGGAGRWYDADWLTTSVAATFSTSDATRRWYTPRWNEANPLWSSFGNFVEGSLDFRPAEAITLVGEGTWDLDLDGFTRYAIGLDFDHSPRMSTGVSYRYFEVPDDYADAFPNNLPNALGELLELAVNYELSKSYKASLTPQYNFSEDDFQSVTGRLTRVLPDFDLTFYVNYDQIEDETSAGLQVSNTKF
ncbi:MAG: LPS assembly protein LptD [Phycisphaerales bacterium]|nr:LPS assembly protein LptD [Phycisphaerales bacterium]